MNTDFIDRHSRQLILPGWTLAFQEFISSITVSTPDNLFLDLYLKALGIEKFIPIESGTTDAPDYYFLSPTTALSNNPNTKGRIGTFEAKVHSNEFEITFTNSESGLAQSWVVSKFNYVEIDQMIGTYLVNCFINVIKENFLIRHPQLSKAS